jgi:hypothetical protein
MKKSHFLDQKKALKKAPNWRVVVKCVINNNDNKMITFSPNFTSTF